MKFSTFEGVVAWSGGNTLIRGGQKFDDEHPLVTERPDLFRNAASETDAAETEAASGSTTRVETTMQSPGSNRVAKTR